MRRFVPLLSWLVALVGVAAVMVVVGHGALAPPPLAPERWGTWAVSVGPAAAALAVVRLVVLVLAAYLVVATALAVSAELVRNAVVIDLSELLALPSIRRAVHVAVGASLVGAAVAGGASVLDPIQQPSTTSAASADRLLDPAPTLEVLSETATTTAPPTTVPTIALEPAPTPVLAPPPTWTVAPGDHLWSIARRLLASAWNREPLEAEVVPYWQALVETNRDRLADPDNADLVYPGDEVLVPGLPSAPT